MAMASALIAFLLDQRAQLPPDVAAGGEQRGGLVAEAVHHARDIDAAAAGIAPGGAAAQLARRNHPVDLAGNVD